MGNVALTLPAPGGDSGSWGDKLNAALTAISGDYLSQADGLSKADAAAEYVPFAVTRDEAVPAGDSVQLLSFTSHNTGPATSQLYDAFFTVDTDTQDTGAAIGVQNIGASDCIYLAVAGKAGSPSTPTGIGIDLNRAIGGSAERDPQNSGRALQIADFSTTDQGTDGPMGAYLQKFGNMNSQHLLVKLRANRNALYLETDSTITGYEAAGSLLSLHDAGAGTDLWTVEANGSQVYGQGVGMYWQPNAGNQPFLLGNANTLFLRGGQDGLEFQDNSSTTHLKIAATGFLQWVGAGDVQNTVGAAGAASAMPSAPTRYLKVHDTDGTVLVVPAFASA